MEAFIIMVLIGGVLSVVGAVLKAAGEAGSAMMHDRARLDLMRDQVRLDTEKRAVDLIFEFPALDDREIALLMRDELMNRRAEPIWFSWVNEETVGRMRRTILVEYSRQKRQG